MQYTSLTYLIFLPFAALFYFIIPNKVKKYYLLLLSLFAYMCWNPFLVTILFFVILISYFGGIIIQDCSVLKKRKNILLIFIALCLSFLVYYKYANFLIQTLSSFFSIFTEDLSSPLHKFIMPIGISFFTLQAIGYLIDVYRKTIPAEKNFITFALFLSFFPQITSGPIGRAKDLIPQFQKKPEFDYQRVKSGLLIIIWGFFLKLVIADRCAVIVNQVYANFSQYTGMAIIIATIFYGIQIYGDFYGYTEIARGSARIFGFELMKNFNCPYTASSISDFWRRWHISLSSWFKDYLYIPLGGNRVSSFRNRLNILIIFLVSGLWHGASWNFIVWGGLHGVYQIVGKQYKKLLFNKNRNKNKLLLICKKISSILMTFLLVDFAWLFFRADSFSIAIKMIIHTLTTFDIRFLFDNSLFRLGLNGMQLFILIVLITLMFTFDQIKVKISVFDWLNKQRLIVRWIFYYVIVMVILLCGVYGQATGGFIYFQF